MHLLLIAILLLAAGCGSAKKHPDQASKSPQESLASMKISEDFHAELFKAEPEVTDPVEMVFDEDGRIYIAEMLDYPDDPPAGQPAKSRIRLIDGKRNTIFADQVLAVDAILPWKGGLIVTSAPDIWYMKDTDGDGKADVKKVLYTGFPKVNHEARITNLRLGPDNWIYAANTGSDAKVTQPDHPDRPVLMLRGADFRFRMDKEVPAERASGPAQFGLTMDDWGNRFITQNTIHLRHAVVPAQYLARAPFVEVSAVAFDISDHGKGTSAMYPLTKPQQWRQQRTDIRQKRYNENDSKRVEYVAGFFTAASGGTVYSGDVFPKEYWGNVFTGDVSGNLVHRDVLTPDGVTFKASRSQDKTEFLRSSDMWFRPCNFANGPDGNLYVMDIYREFIETPESIPEELRKGMDFYSGVDMGRIYRIVPNKPLKQRSLDVKLSGSTTDQLVALLEETNGWHRTTAQRLLLERQDKTAVGPLVKLAAESKSPQARLLALYVLESLGGLDTAKVKAALKDTHPGVREHALQLAESFAADASVRDAVYALAKDAEVRVRYQLAYSIGTFDDARRLATLAEFARTDGDDRWFRTAILVSAASQPADLLKMLLTSSKTGGGEWQKPDFITGIAGVIGARQKPAEITALLAAIPNLKSQAAALNGLQNGFKLTEAKRLQVAGAEPLIMGLLALKDAKAQAAAWSVARYFSLPGLVARASREAVLADLPEAQRTLAVRALGGGEYAAVAKVVEEVFGQNPSPAVQSAAVEALGNFGDKAAGQQILSHWKTYSPEARAKAAGALLSRKEWMELLVDAIEGGTVTPAVLDIAAKSRLAESSERAKKLLVSAGGDRAKVVTAYMDVTRLAGDVSRGKKLFEENCGKCHTARREGGRVGPDLSGVNNKTKEELLASILNPSLSIDPRFVNYMVTTKDGRMFDGVIGNETPGAITLRGGSADGDQTILRQSIAEIRASNVSLMPDEFEKTLDRQGLADVIAYLRAGL